MALILGIESSCDETAASVYDSSAKKILSSCVFSQTKLHEIFGGVVPEIASRSHLEKIGPIVNQSLIDANISLDEIDYIAVTNKPGLIGSLLVGLCFAKGICWAKQKKLIAVDHLEAHIFSAFLKNDLTFDENLLKFPHLNLSVSGGHTNFYLVKGFGEYELLGQTLDDAAGEAFDKIGYVLGLGYPGGPIIEKLAKEVNFEDFYKYPRSKREEKDLNFSFSGLKTAVLYDLVKKNIFDLKSGILKENITPQIQAKVASSLLVCIGDIFEHSVKIAFNKYPEATGLSFVGGVACNKYLAKKLETFCTRYKKDFVNPPCKFCCDNAAMVALVGAYKASKNQFTDLTTDVFDRHLSNDL
ncbi:TPA: tRNA (adenosine(37)-N6)-threonylcarbamoyltransferase complex transferase subunit TsaD [Candidatus Dependentiae bacterium]|nr:MAG: Gcp: predicted O-sialoglycoprotein endopeptidase [candidate division TM6 bacterium GW2011_GWE2_31_21]KKP53477.1 MAG: Gcp: predicted O-sialoglycoprotein endopeptidase [candidate division TM6 bacterium GW2011_GWF2_33_332]HBS48281.1 tRNA (adenosine(37)-N6)-threonylcarbamoyltransferase complex transferase subunit TsaD [Candidatus Dependentiae bacterium]HBZ73708.1 tRNA (adenosine(37)-N6)-threonylcarbamoyltransferase complex transferase subunit TsaD [Candidatus Dependentiae bacterium]